MDSAHHPPDPASLPHLILDALPVTMRVLAAQMRDTPHNLHSGHLPVLAALQEGARTQSELADMMSVSGATMSNTLTALEERGWVERTRSQTDRRVIHIHLTPAGTAAFYETMAEMEKHLDALLAHLDDAAREELRRGLVILQAVFYRALEGSDE
jgi:DNA-binding MarR family transcriptional regulator